MQNQREAFAREAATALEELVAHEGATRVILAGDAVAIPLLHRALSPQLEPLIQEEILRLDIRTPRHAVLREVVPILAQLEEEESYARADRLVAAVREQGLGVIGRQETRDALEHGQGEVLVLAGNPFWCRSRSGQRTRDPPTDERRWRIVALSSYVALIGYWGFHTGGSLLPRIGLGSRALS